MVLNQGGNKAKKKASKDVKQEKKLLSLQELVKVQGEEEYALIRKKLGDGRYTVLCTDGKERMAIASGNIKKRTRVELGDITLVSIREYQDNKCDMSHVYTPEETRVLLKNNEFPQCFVTDGIMEKKEDDRDDINFEDDTDDGLESKEWINDI